MRRMIRDFLAFLITSFTIAALAIVLL